MDKFVLVGAVNVFSQSIVIGVTNTSGGSCNAVLGKSLVVDNADVLRAVIRMVCQMRVFGTGVLGTRYCRVPGSWYRAEGYVGPGR